ncbi:hypothetical protein FB451DRAFT_1221065, partial [Mycena latifolia]
SAAPSFTYPRQISGLPRDATHLALDEHAREIIAFSRRGEQLGRFAFANGTDINISRRNVSSGACADLSSDDVQKLPGWNTLKSTAEKNWGTGSYNVVTNDKNYPDSPAQNCVSTDVVQIALDGNPSASGSCHTTNDKSDGKMVGSDGTVALTETTGTVYTTSTTVTQESSISAGVSISATVGIPEVESVTAGYSFSATFTNSLSSAQTQESDESHSSTVTVNNPAGKTCHLEFTTQTCTLTGTGSIRMLGTGWVWFEYNDQTQGHYKWALSIDQTLTNQDDRSTFIKFKTSTGTTSNTNYTSHCQ